MNVDVFAAFTIAALVVGNAQPSHAGAASGPNAQNAVAPSAEVAGDRSDTYGSADTSYVLGAWDFGPFNSTSTFDGLFGTGDRFSTSAGGLFQAPVHLPNGAVITRMEIQGCDANAGADMVGTLRSNTTINGTQSEIEHGFVVMGGTPTPACGFFSANLSPPVVVTNQTRTYYMFVSMGAATDSTLRFSAVRLFYHLQVSAAPATATFPNDVPTTHPFFRFVEAMAASGLTGGCGTGSFCPDTPVTRGQLSVFLAVALGLHFPN